MHDTSQISCALFNLRKTTRAITQLYDDLLKPTGLRSTQYSMLRVIRGLGPIAVNELGEAMGMDRTTVTRNVRLLVRMGYLRVEPGEDRRTRLVRVSPRGRSVVDKALPYWEEAQAVVVEGLGKKRWQKLRSELAAVADVSRDGREARMES